MKKLCLICILMLLLVAKVAFGQNPYYDALKLASYSKLSKDLSGRPTIELSPDNTSASVAERKPIADSIVSILKRYFPAINNTIAAKSNDISNLIEANPFFLNVSVNGLQQGGGSNPTLINLPSVLSSVGNLDVTNFADGLAKFLVERTKQELATAFFENFKKKLDGCKPLQILFPSTYKALSAIGQEVYNYAAYIDLLRESFQKDLAVIIPNLSLLVQDPSMDTIFKSVPYLKSILIDALYIANEFNSGKHPGDVFHDYITIQADSTLLGAINANVYPSLQLLDIFSQSLRSKQSNKYWVTVDSVKLLFKTPAAFQIYMGLIYQQIINEKIIFQDKTGKHIDFRVFLSQHAADIINYEDSYNIYLTGLIQKGNEVDRYYLNIKQLIQKGQDKPTYQDYYSLYNSALNFFEQLLPSPTLLNLKDSATVAVINKMEDKVSKYLQTARGLGNIYVDIYEKQYSSAVIEAGTILAYLSDKTNNLSTLFIKYGNFAAELSKAQNSDDVEKAIEAVAMPAGSSSVKRASAFNVALNAYVGPFIGSEKIHGVDTKYKGTYGLSVPIGVAASWGHRFLPFSTGNSKWSTSIFVSVIDIGALASYRFSSGSSAVGGDSTAKVAQVPKIQLKNIISPGAFLSIGFPGVPISLSGGYQLAPNLRSVSLNSNNTVVNTYGDDKLTGRWYISLSVDIPLLNFYTKDRNP